MYLWSSLAKRRTHSPITPKSVNVEKKETVQKRSRKQLRLMEASTDITLTEKPETVSGVTIVREIQSTVTDHNYAALVQQNEETISTSIN